MKTVARALMVMGMIAGMVTVAAGAQEKKVQLAVTLGLLAGDDDGEDIGVGICPGVRVDFNLTKSFMISPEASLFLGGRLTGAIYPGCTVNYRFGKGFIGLGAMVIAAMESPIMLKAHIGAKGRHHDRLAAQRLEVVGDVAGATAPFAAHLADLERDRQHVRLLRQDVPREAIGKHHDGVVGERATDERA